MNDQNTSTNLDEKEIGMEIEESDISGASSYLSRLTKQRLLTAEEERRLSEKIKLGDMKAKDRLVEANMRLVLNVAKNYHNSLIPFEDLIQEGAIGLMMAAERFDSAKGFRFSTYATYWIRQAISRALDSKSKSIRLPSHIIEDLRKIDRLRTEWTRHYGEEPTPEQMANHLQISQRKMDDLLLIAQEPVSLDMLVGDGESTTLGGLLNDHTAADPEDTVINAETEQVLISLLATLTPREREIMRRRFGFGVDSSQLLSDIGQTMHLSREKVRQIEVHAIRKLKFAAKRSELKDYMIT